MLPMVSTPMTRMAGFCSLRNLATPLIVPPVPTPVTQWVILPSVWRQISGPVER